MSEPPRIIPVDDHVVQPRELWAVRSSPRHPGGTPKVESPTATAPTLPRRLPGRPGPAPPTLPGPTGPAPRNARAGCSGSPRSTRFWITHDRTRTTSISMTARYSSW